ncbi:MAG: iron uptake porin, partial [Synechococcus sp. WH 8007]|nr:iron uptake porin [Synechococcus sp. WH 8007]
ACLDRITEVTDELKRLMKEFERELAILKGRVDGLEARVGELEATQFSTTTKLEGDYYWAVGAVTATGGKTQSDGKGSRDWYNKNYGAATMVYDARLNLKTSFTGKDLLYTRLRAGDFSKANAFGGGGFNLTKFDKAFDSAGVIELDRLYYRFPVGKEFKFAVGPVARNTEFLGTKPFYYKGWSGLDFFQLFGAPGTYNKATGSLVGAIWKQKVKKGQPYFTVSSSYVASAGNGSDGSKGLMTGKSEASTLTQVAYNANQWKATFGWNYTQCGDDTTREGTQATMKDIPCQAADGAYLDSNTKGHRNAFATTLAWRPKNTGLIPSISGGWGYNAYSYGISNTGSNPAQTGAANSSSTGKPGIAGNLNVLNIQSTQSWTVGLQWDDAFTKGNVAGLAVGQPTFVTSTRNGTTPFDAGYVWEGFYKFQVSDNIAITPVLFYMSNPSSAGAGYAQTSDQGSNLGVFGGALTTRIKF